ncbi:MAG: PAAR domain-containing protein [Polyangiaceae bacterium]|nr:PAAR domain-containing protein [Polyangiaceae bacterium]
MFEMAHVGHYVLQNADAKFSKFKSGPGKPKSKKDKTQVYDKKKGRDFWQSTDDSGNVNAMGFKAPAAICADGAPKGVAGDTYQPTTSFQFSDGSYINADTIPYVVLPQAKNSAGNWASAHNVKGNPFGDAGIKPGDYVKITNPANGNTVYAIWGENGPSGEVGEISMAAARDLGLNDSPISGGFTTMTDSQYLNYEFYPGSGKRTPNGSRIQKQTSEEIQKAGRIAAGERSVSGGYVIVAGKDSVLVGKGQRPAAFADPRSFHEGGCPLALGSDSVFIDGRPAVRVGDACTCGQKVVSGEGTVFVFGNPTSQGAQPGPADPFSLWGLKPYPPQSPFGNIDLNAPPAWAKDALGPQMSTLPGFMPSTPTGADLLNMWSGNLFAK